MQVKDPKSGYTSPRTHRFPYILSAADMTLWKIPQFISHENTTKTQSHKATTEAAKFDNLYVKHYLAIFIKIKHIILTQF